MVSQQELRQQGLRGRLERQQRERIRREQKRREERLQETIEQINKGKIKSVSEIPESQREKLNIQKIKSFFSERKNIEQKNREIKRKNQYNLALRVYTGQVSGGVKEFQEIPSEIKKEAKRQAEKIESRRGFILKEKYGIDIKTLEPIELEKVKKKTLIPSEELITTKEGVKRVSEVYPEFKSTPPTTQTEFYKAVGLKDPVKQLGIETKEYITERPTGEFLRDAPLVETVVVDQFGREIRKATKSETEKFEKSPERKRVIASTEKIGEPLTLGNLLTQPQKIDYKRSQTYQDVSAKYQEIRDKPFIGTEKEIEKAGKEISKKTSLFFGEKGGELVAGTVTGLAPKTTKQAVGTLALGFGVGKGVGLIGKATKGTRLLSPLKATGIGIGGATTAYFTYEAGRGVVGTKDYRRKGEIIGETIREFSLFGVGFGAGFKPTGIGKQTKQPKEEKIEFSKPSKVKKTPLSKTFGEGIFVGKKGDILLKEFKPEKISKTAQAGLKRGKEIKKQEEGLFWDIDKNFIKGKIERQKFRLKKDWDVIKIDEKGIRITQRELKQTKQPKVKKEKPLFEEAKEPVKLDIKPDIEYLEREGLIKRKPKTTQAKQKQQKQQLLLEKPKQKVKQEEKAFQILSPKELAKIRAKQKQQKQMQILEEPKQKELQLSPFTRLRLDQKTKQTQQVQLLEKPKQKVKQKSQVLETIRGRQFDILKEREKIKEGIKPKIRLFERVKQKELQGESVLQLQPQLEKTRLGERQKDRIKEAVRLFDKELQREKTRQRERIKPRKGIEFPEPKSSKAKIIQEAQKLRDTFKVFVKKEGKDVKIGEFEQLPKAKEKLVGELKSTLRASGFITKGGKPVNIKLGFGEFRRGKTEPFRVVQKKTTRFGTRPETQEAQLFRVKKGGKKIKFI